MTGFHDADADALRDVAGPFQERSRKLDELCEEPREPAVRCVVREEG